MNCIIYFNAKVKRKYIYKFNRLSQYMGPQDLHGLREAWAYFETPESHAHPQLFDETINFMRQLVKGKKV